MQEKSKANAFGKNPDYFFAKGMDYLNINDYPSAIKCFAKGVKDKHTHLLCRFNLGYVLFKVGHYPEAASQFQVLSQQCLELRIHPEDQIPLVQFNTTASELQAGLYPEAVRSAQVCIDILKAKEREQGGNVLNLHVRERELIITILQLQGLSFFKSGKLKEAGISLEQAEMRKNILKASI
jgi:tetratricopeptide (TPR) repeat protein